MDTIPRPEYPRPQFFRDRWKSLNGTWTFTLDHGKSGGEPDRGFGNSLGFEREIRVPFCPESTLSGVGHTDFIECMWYHRTLDIPADWAGQDILLHFGGVDYQSELFLDGRSVGTHFGGTSSFTHDITRFVRAGGSHQLVLRVQDDMRPDGGKPMGKQSTRFGSYGCHYTRTTGIWQTVWVEAVDPHGLADVQVLPDLDNGAFVFIPAFRRQQRDLGWTIRVRAGDDLVAEVNGPAVNGIPLRAPVPAPRAWSPQDPFLYDVEYTVTDGDGTVLDQVQGYAGLRKVHIEGNRVFLNNRPIYLRLVLDQGFYPDGVWTAPSDEALKLDIELSQAAGFNGARLHQKVFEERFHYWADRLGYLTWGEASSWGCDPNRVDSAHAFLCEWRAILLRDRNHPSIIAWTPWNETHDVRVPSRHQQAHREAYALCKALDPARPVNDASGYVHVQTDLWTSHTYTQDPAALAAELAPTAEEPVWRSRADREPPYAGQPYIVDEFGGIKWIPPDRRPHADDSWGYGDAPRTLEEFHLRLAGQVEVLLGYDHIAGYCYTQLTDVEQEQNGIYNYDRSPKFDMARIREVFAQVPPGWDPDRKIGFVQPIPAPQTVI